MSNKKPPSIDWGEAVAWGMVIIIAVLVLVAAQTDKANSGLCPPGHSIAIEQPGPYYVYTPNTPAGYSIVWVDDVATVMPPPGVYGTEGTTVRVCYTDDIYTFAASIPSTTTTTQTPKVAVTEYCEVDGVPGIVHPIDGCYTTDDYDRDFPNAGLGRSEHRDPPSPIQVSPSERPRYFAGIELPSFAHIVSRSIAL